MKIYPCVLVLLLHQSNCVIFVREYYSWCDWPILGFFKDFFICTAHIVANVKMSLNDNLQRIWKEEVMGNFIKFLPETFLAERRKITRTLNHTNRPPTRYSNPGSSEHKVVMLTALLHLSMWCYRSLTLSSAVRAAAAASSLVMSFYYLFRLEMWSTLTMKYHCRIILLHSN
jgi:hypothetical protein